MERVATATTLAPQREACQGPREAPKLQGFGDCAAAMFALCPLPCVSGLFPVLQGLLVLVSVAKEEDACQGRMARMARFGLHPRHRRG